MPPGHRPLLGIPAPCSPRVRPVPYEAPWSPEWRVRLVPPAGGHVMGVPAPLLRHMHLLPQPPIRPQHQDMLLLPPRGCLLGVPAPVRLLLLVPLRSGQALWQRVRFVPLAVSVVDERLVQPSPYLGR